MEEKMLLRVFKKLLSKKYDRGKNNKLINKLFQTSFLTKAEDIGQFLFE